MQRLVLTFLALAVLILASCSPLPAPAAGSASPMATSDAPASGSDVSGSPLITPTDPAPVGEVSAAGFIYTNANGARQPLPDIPVRLAHVVWNADKSDGAFVLEGGTSPIATTDAKGSFAFRNVPAGDYVIVVGDPSAKHEIISTPDGKAKIFTITDQGAEVWGEIVVSLAP